MTHRSEPVIPTEFLCTLIADEHSVDSSLVRIAAERARSATGVLADEELLTLLLNGPYRTAAPSWLIETAIDYGLRENTRMPNDPRPPAPGHRRARQPFLSR